MADPEHVARALDGDLAGYSWKDTKQITTLDLTGADLRRALLHGANLSTCKLRGANLENVDMRGALLVGADMRDTNLRGADLSYAFFSHTPGGPRKRLPRAASVFSMTTLHNADLTGAILDCADVHNILAPKACFISSSLYRTRFEECSLQDNDFSNARCSQTVFADVDLSTAKGLDTVAHSGPSWIDASTLYRSKGQIPIEFLRGAGIPENLVVYLRSLTAEAIEYFTCFISFTEADDAFSERLYNDLQAAGIRCWRWKEDARRGEFLIDEVDVAIRTYDKLIVILSKDSLNSEPVMREIERGLQRQQRERRAIIFPISLDKAVFSWEKALQTDLLRHCIADFSGWKDGDNYRRARDRLIEDLKQSRPG